MKVVPFESLVTVSYSPSSIVTVAVSLAMSEIFSVKEWPDLEIWVCGRSRSLKNFTVRQTMYDLGNRTQTFEWLPVSMTLSEL